MHVRRTVLSCLLAAAALAPPGTAYAEGPDGEPCAMVTRGADDHLEVVLAGGPVAATGTLTCTVQVGAATHDGADTVSESADGLGVVVLAPRVVEIPPTRDDLYVCTRFTPAAGAPWYWSAEAGAWSSDPAVPCDQEVPAVRALKDMLDAMCSVDLCPWPPFGDSAWCPVMAGLAGDYVVARIGSYGDGYLNGERVWDCPPYGV